jgi:hypothetical protein
MASTLVLLSSAVLSACVEPGTEPVRQRQVLSLNDSVQMFSLERSEGFLDLSFARLDTSIPRNPPVGLESVDFAEKLGFARSDTGALTYSVSRSKTDLESFQIACNSEDCSDVTVGFAKTNPATRIAEAANFRVVGITALSCTATSMIATNVSSELKFKFRSATIAKNLTTGKTALYARSSEFDAASRRVVENVLRNTIDGAPVLRLNSISSSTLSNGQRRDVVLRSEENSLLSSDWNEAGKTFRMIARPTAPVTAYQVDCKY